MHVPGPGVETAITPELRAVFLEIQKGILITIS
jgi:hypothetical protein